MRNLNLEDVYHVEKIGPNSQNFHFSLKFYGKTPEGNGLSVTVELPAWGVGILASELWGVHKKHEAYLLSDKLALEGK